TNVKTASTYSISGKLSGNIVIDTGDAYKFDLELQNFSLVSDSINPITVLSGDEVSIQAKKDTENFIYDTRATVSEDDTTSVSGAIYSEVDLEIAGKGQLTVVSSNNNGIHSKKDLQVKNLDLTVSCKNNALKGNDSVELEAAKATLIATVGDCIKTTKTDISGKGNQRGIVSFLDGSYELYAACDGIDAAYDVIVDGNTTINIYTDKYSNYSEESTETSESNYYIRFSYSDYKYSIKYYNSDDDFTWVNAEYHSTVSGGRSKYYYYSFPKNTDYAKLQFFIYSSNMEQGQDSDYVACSDYITLSDAYDTIALSNRGSYISYNWTNYSSSVSSAPGGMFPGGMNDGNTDKGDHSAKGIKSANDIKILSGILNIKSYDDAIHAKSGEALENGATSTGNVVINGGSLNIYTNDDGVHADGSLTVNNGNINIINSYEGMEGTTVGVLGGNVSIISKDDGINATSTSGTTITVGGGTLYIYCGGDGVDSNSRTSYGGILFSGGQTLIISTSGGNSAIDSEAGYNYTGGSVVAVMPRGGMSNEAARCQNFSSVGKSTELSLTKGGYLVCEVGGAKLTVNMPTSLSAFIVMLGDSKATASSKTTDSHNLSEGEFIWE
ncbi:MAG: carbohydrate-binding domain-containing protein, partial [Clostridia bacterium]|nr:carbohydrate-binding domain-containing protein [Clostridia bacterium]